MHSRFAPLLSLFLLLLGHPAVAGRYLNRIEAAALKDLPGIAVAPTDITGCPTKLAEWSVNPLSPMANEPQYINSVPMVNLSGNTTSAPYAQMWFALNLSPVPDAATLEKFPGFIQSTFFISKENEKIGAILDIALPHRSQRQVAILKDIYVVPKLAGDRLAIASRMLTWLNFSELTENPRYENLEAVWAFSNDPNRTAFLQSLGFVIREMPAKGSISERIGMVIKTFEFDIPSNRENITLLEWR